MSKFEKVDQIFFDKPKQLCVDFDGVIHTYMSGWENDHTILDGAVPGAIDWLIEMIKEGFVVCIYSSRSKKWRGRRAMKKWLRAQLINATGALPMSKPILWWLSGHSYMDPWEYVVSDAADRFVKSLRFPVKKPPAYLTIDDRAICFNGTFPTVKEMLEFKPWNRKEKHLGNQTFPAKSASHGIDGERHAISAELSADQIESLSK